MTCKLYYRADVPLFNLVISKLSDGEISGYLNDIFYWEKLAPEYLRSFYFSNYLVVDELRARIVEDKLKPEDFELYIWDGKEYKRKIFDEYSGANYIAGEDIRSNLLERIIKGMFAKLERKNSGNSII